MRGEGGSCSADEDTGLRELREEASNSFVVQGIGEKSQRRRYLGCT